MLDFKSSESEESFESTFMSTFSVSYTDMYSCLQTVPLKENGQNIPITEDNVQVTSESINDYYFNDFPNPFFLKRNLLIFIQTGC